VSSIGTTPEASNLNLLLFSVGAVCFAVDLEQIDGMAEHAGELAADLHWFHEILAFGDKTVTYRLPTVLSVRTENLQPYRVIIDSMEEISECCLNAITPFPPLLEPHALKCGLWGVLQRDAQMVLLVDFQRMARNAPHKQSRTCEGV
jgi:hypothetical protein